MPILRPYLTPTTMPQQVIAPQRLSRRGRQGTLAQSRFYEQQLSASQQGANPLVTPEPQTRPAEPQSFVNQPESGGFIQEQIQRIQDRAAPPALQPSARVRSVNAELVQPSSFQKYYEMLSTIEATGKNQLEAAKARASYQRLAQMQALTSQPVQQPVLANYQPTDSASGASMSGSLPSKPQTNFQFAQNIAGNYGWSDPRELSAWYTLGMKESGWRNTAQNPTSTAYGIGQFLNSTWNSVGIPKTSDPRLQVEAMDRYIKQRYGSPSRALAFHLSHNWY